MAAKQIKIISWVADYQPHTGSASQQTCASGAVRGTNAVLAHANGVLVVQELKSRVPSPLNP